MKRIIFLLFFLFFTSQAQSNQELINSLKEGGKLVFIRHALAPGGGDPENFKISDCSTQRNLNQIDFFPFKSNSAKLAMTAHILFSKIDNKNVSTFSKKIINQIIRKKIGFKGILMSDDISMKALKYDLVTNAKKALEAGCNLVLYCEGKIKDNLKLIKSVPYIDKFTVKKTSEIYKILR